MAIENKNIITSIYNSNINNNPNYRVLLENGKWYF